MSRHPSSNPLLSSPRNLRLGTLILVFITISQIDDPLMNATIGQELAYWFVRIVFMAGGLWSADILVSRFLANRWVNPVWLKPVIIVSAVGLLPFALAEMLIEPHLPMRPEYVDDDLWAISPLLAFVAEYATILTIVVPVHLLLWLIIDRKAQSPPGVVPDEPLSVPEFLGRSSGLAVDDVLALQAEEHYVRIHTESGAELVHYRFGDAVEEMPAELGLRVHRSWWVAGSAVRSAKRGSRRWQLNLVSDVAVPVSDSYVKAVRERGWLKRKQRG
ncbi:MAG: LytTR family DNA-binding domain-containing protein [Woeseiaceae bacterium]|nr:LytTR family DNA-binding domain-containing protein [Woeseiaceae bacterium]